MEDTAYKTLAEPDAKGQLHTALVHQKEELEHLHHMISTLESRLAPVTLQRDMPEPGRGETPREVLAPIASTIDDNNGVIRTALRRLEVLIEQLEV